MTPPPFFSDSETTTSTRLDTLASSSAFSGSKLASPMSPLTSLGSAKSDFVSLPRKRVQHMNRASGAYVLNRSGPLVKQDRVQRQDRLQSFRARIRAQYRPRLIHNSPAYEITFAKRHIMQSSHKDFSQQDLREVIVSPPTRMIFT